MFKFVTLYYKVDDETALELFFAKTQLPLSEQLPGLMKSEVSRVSHQPGGESRFYLMYELYFGSKLTFQEAFATEIGVKLIQSLKPWSDAHILTWFFAESFEEEAQSRGPSAPP